MANKPRIRFKGFTEDWEQCKLSDITEVIMGQSPSSKNYTDNPNDDILVQGNADLKDGKVVPRLWTKEITKTIDKGGIILTVRAPVGDVAKTDYKVVLGRGVAGIKGNDYIYQFLQKLQYNRYWVSLSSGSTFESINSNDIKDLIIDIPSIEEQTKISMLLNNVNSIITLHQCKLEKLKLTKKALLQKLFPKNGKHIPEIRFKGFTDTWEQRKLNDFGIATGGTSLESEFVDGGNYKVISIGSYSEESVYNDQGLRVNKSDKTKSRILNKNDLTMILNDKTASGNIIGRVLLIDQDNTYVYNQRTERIEVDRKNFLPIFLYHMLNAPEQRKYIVKASQGNTQIYVNWSAISNINYMIPQLLIEQEKIAYLFSLINKDITLHQRKLERLQEVKKGLLQKMFV